MQRISYRNYIQSLYTVLCDTGVITQINPVLGFNDDPKIFHYAANLTVPRKLTDGPKIPIFSSAFSFSSREFALFKCLAESVERFALACFRKEYIAKTASYNQLLKKQKVALDPFLLTKTTTARERMLAWMEGKELTLGKTAYVPVQQIFINYPYPKNELQLTKEVNSTGVAAGLDDTTAILRGIYEVVERDAYMGVFLGTITPSQIELSAMKEKSIQHLYQVTKRYNFSLHSFAITNDVGIPTFMSLLVDKTGIGQSIVVGLKTHEDALVALTGSIEEAINTRPLYREELYTYKTNTLHVSSYNEIKAFSQRSLFWSSPAQLSKLEFLFSAPYIKWNYPKYTKSPMQTYTLTMSRFRKKKWPVFAVDITMRKLKVPLVVWNVFIPHLHPFYTQEDAKMIDEKRLSEIATSFGKVYTKPNPLPHIFL